jgi:plasmid stabilization system protein ParE
MRAKRRLDWTQTARRQYLDQLAWIAERNPTAAQGVQRRIEHSLDLIQTDAALGTPDKKKRRRHPVPRTPFTIYYRIKRSSIQVLRVLHDRQDR